MTNHVSGIVLNVVHQFGPDLFSSRKSTPQLMTKSSKKATTITWWIKN